MNALRVTQLFMLLTMLSVWTETNSLPPRSQKIVTPPNNSPAIFSKVVAYEPSRQPPRVSLLSLPEYVPVRHCYRWTWQGEASSVHFDQLAVDEGEIVELRSLTDGVLVKLRTKSTPSSLQWVKFNTLETQFHLFPTSREWTSRSPLADIICKGASQKAISEWKASANSE